jgi:hypothetical protein
MNNRYNMEEQHVYSSSCQKNIHVYSTLCTVNYAKMLSAQGLKNILCFSTSLPSYYAYMFQPRAGHLNFSIYDYRGCDQLDQVLGAPRRPSD